MRRLIAAAAVALMMSAAPAVATTWTGCYAGGHAGAGVASTETSVGGITVDGLASQGALGGLHGGCDFQVPGSAFVLGAFGEYTWGEMSFDIRPSVLKATLDERWAIGGRAGIAVGNALPYLTGGWTQAKSSLTVVGTAISSPDYAGWFVGGGVEFQIPAWPSLSIGAEYRYTRFGSETIATFVQLEPEAHTAMLRVNWRPSLFSEIVK